MTELKEKIKALVQDDLAEIETALAENLNPYYDLVEQIAGHLLYSGGKRLRPLLMVLSARLCGYNGNGDKKFSVLFEYLHAATLLHDDLVDEASVRRGKEVAHLKFGNAETVLTGDFLLARSLSLAAATGKPELIQVIAKITEDMSQGEIQQLHNKGRIDLSEEEYTDVIERKTAVLIRGACHSGALIADADKKKAEALIEYGYCLGIAFQLADDLLDYTADTESLGKEPGADLREGKLTLPLIYTLEKADSNDRDEMKKIIESDTFSEEAFGYLTKLLEKYGGLSYTREKAVDNINRAKKALSVFEPSETRQVLELLADYALVRKV